MELAVEEVISMLIGGIILTGKNQNIQNKTSLCAWDGTLVPSQAHTFHPRGLPLTTSPIAWLLRS
jgi:hypothetical protein